MEHHSPLGTLWAGLGMGAYFTALLWINVLLSMFLSPLFQIPMTWIMDRVQGRRKWNEPAVAREAVAARLAARRQRMAAVDTH